jgi:hypothetical protein
MTAFEEITASIRDSNKLDATSRDLLLQFLAAGAPLFQSLETAALGTLMTWLAGSSAVPPPREVDQLSSKQILALLELTQVGMDAAVKERREELAAARAAVEGLGQAALSLLARLLIAAL